MSVSYRFARNWFAYVVVFVLSACGGGGGGDSDRDGASSANEAVAAANRTVPDNVFTAVLAASQEAQSGGSTGTGIGIVMVDPANRLMRATLTTAGMEGVSAHIQLAPSGSGEAIVFSLIETPAGSGVWTAETTLTEEQLSALRNENYYASVRSTAFPEGEIGGRILAQLPGRGTINSVEDSGGNANAAGSGSFTGGDATDTTETASGAVNANNAIGAGTDSSGALDRYTRFVNVLTGTQQLPANGSDEVAMGVAIVDRVGRTMVASITSLRIAGISAHIHEALAGSEGDTVFTLNETAPDSEVWMARFPLSESQLDTLESGNYYFDVHTAAFPGGELRGQIVERGGTGGFDDNSGAVTTEDTGTVPGAVTGTSNTGDSLPGSITGSAPTLGNPAGSGIGSGGSTGFGDASVPTFGNPLGSGIGSGAGSSIGAGSDFSGTSVSGAPASDPNAGFSGIADDSSNFVTSTNDFSGTGGLNTVQF